MKNSGYINLAYYYDRLTIDVNYEKMSKYILKCLDKYNKKENAIICDLACGTGSLLANLAITDNELIGIDISENMLSIAQKKLESYKNVLLLKQDIADFELYGTVDLITCMLDGVNHLTDIKKLEKLFYNVHNYLNNGGLFIFDINTEYKFKKLYGNKTYFEEYDDFTYLWHNSYDHIKKICEFYMLFFIRNKKGEYIKKNEINYERYYSDFEIDEIIKKTGLEILEIVDFFTYDNNISEKTEKKVYVLKKADLNSEQAFVNKTPKIL